MRSPSPATPEQLSVERGVVRYGNDHTVWSMPVDDIRVLGEYTTPDGPLAEDYFVVFIDLNGNQHEVPASAMGREATDALRARIGDLAFGLANSAGYASRIMWPPQYAGKPLYTITPRPAQSIGNRLLKLLGSSRVEFSLSPSTEAALRAVPEPSPTPVNILAMLNAYQVKLIADLLRHYNEVKIDSTNEEEVAERISEKTYEVLLADLARSGRVLDEIRNHPQFPAHVLDPAQGEELERLIRDRLRKDMDR